MTNKCFSEIETIIKDWFTDIEKIKTSWEEIRGLNPDFEQVSEIWGQNLGSKIWGQIWGQNLGSGLVFGYLTL